jgi:hypothetical protein
METFKGPYGTMVIDGVAESVSSVDARIGNDDVNPIPDKRFDVAHHF